MQVSIFSDSDVKNQAIDLANQIAEMIRGASDLTEQIDIINSVREAIHTASPFRSEPIDFVRWVTTDKVTANDYNPNSVAPPEMELLRHSIEHDGYTQPVVGWRTNNQYEVVDGFHRTKVAKSCDSVRERLRGYMPIVAISESNESRNDRIASTIRHNRARGKHNVNSMSDIVIELKKRNWSDTRIAKELGMDADEVLRLCQVSGLVEVFADEEFSKAWESAIHSTDDLDVLTEDDL